MRPRPLPPKARDNALDALRGFAVFASIPVIVHSFAAPTSTRTTVYRPELISEHAVDQALPSITMILQQLLFHQSALFLFSIVFGAGIILMRQKGDIHAPALQNLPSWLGKIVTATHLRRVFGESAAGLNARRMLWLALFGLASYAFISHHDHLILFALSGAILFFATHFTWQKLLGLSAVIALIGASLSMWISDLVFASNPDYFANLATGDKQPLPINLAIEQAYLTSNWADQIVWRWQLLRDAFFQIEMLQSFWQIAAGTALGMALLKAGWLKAERLKSRYLMLLVFGICLGTPLVFSGLVADIRLNAVIDAHIGIGEQLTKAGGLLIALGEIGLLMLFAKSRTCEGFCAWLRALGRMPLSTYTFTGLFCAVFFYAAKQLGTASPLAISSVILCIWITTLGFSKFWLSHCRKGPLEWLWRMAIYGDSLPLFLISRSNAGDPASTERIS